MSHALALMPGMDTRWIAVGGPMKGTVRVMSVPEFTIGRSADCEFPISNDPKVSRRHATVRFSPQGCEIIALSEKNPVLLNGHEISQAIMRPGDTLTVGDTELQFQLPLPPPSPVPTMPYGAPAHYGSPAPYGGPAPRPQAPRRPPAPRNNKRLLIYGVVGLIFAWLFLSESPKKKEEARLRTEQQMEADIKAAEQLREAAEARASKRHEPSVNARQAQANFVRGFRDYREGQYERATVSFQACLALNPEHPLCNRYLKLSQRRFSEVVQYHMVNGRKYRDQNHYRNCRSSFRNVMVMIKDASNPIYKEAKANFEACNAFLEGRF